jgi:hypothetical protein
MTSPDQQDNEEARRGGLVRRVLNQGPSPEQQLEEIIAQRRSELDAHAERLRESIAELEHREELLRDSRRFGRAHAETRNRRPRSPRGGADVVPVEPHRARDLTLRCRGRPSLGAGRSSAQWSSSAPRSNGVRRAVAARENELAELEQQATERAPVTRRTAAPVELVFVPGERYRLVEIDTTPLTRGYVFEVEGLEYAVARIGRSPLPGDARSCAYLVRGRTALSAPAAARRRRSLIPVVGGCHRSRAGAPPETRGTARRRCRPPQNDGAASRRARRGPMSVPTRGSGA